MAISLGILTQHFQTNPYGWTLFSSRFPISDLTVCTAWHQRIHQELGKQLEGNLYMERMGKQRRCQNKELPDASSKIKAHHGA